ncbi:MAG: aldo/keto reductase, partial [Anaerolineae bacterium]|nr:aldo/keto reductase [Anaerolineae bacterium]
LLPLPKTTDPAHMRSNADVDFVISDADMAVLKNVPQIEDYGDASMMPVFGRKLNLRSMLSMVVRSIRS